MAGLKRSARVIVTCWVLTMVPLIIAELGYVLWNLPRLLTTGLRSVAEQATGTWYAFADGQIAAGLVGVVGEFMILCPLAGAGYLTVRLSGRLVRATLRATEGNLRLRLVICTGVLATAGALSAAWMGGMTPKPLPPQPPIIPILQPGVPTLRAAETPSVSDETPHDDARPGPVPTSPSPDASLLSPTPDASPSDEADTASGSPSAEDETKTAAPTPKKATPSPTPTRRQSPPPPGPSSSAGTPSTSPSAPPSTSPSPPLPTESFPDPFPW